MVADESSLTFPHLSSTRTILFSDRLRQTFHKYRTGDALMLQLRHARSLPVRDRMWRTQETYAKNWDHRQPFQKQVLVGSSRNPHLTYRWEKYRLEGRRVRASAEVFTQRQSYPAAVCDDVTLTLRCIPYLRLPSYRVEGIEMLEQSRVVILVGID